jgi:ATP-binding protein involved in chromosome partitioning
MSTDLLLNDGAPLRWREPEHERFVWRGTLETGMLREFLADVEWGSLDVLLVDLPPGIDRLESLTELVPGISGVLAVTIPSDASERAVRRALAATAERGTRVLGIVENMSGYLCDGCSEVRALFPGDAGASLSSASGAPLLARLPFHPGADDGALAAEFGRLSTGLWDRLESE